MLLKNNQQCNLRHTVACGIGCRALGPCHNEVDFKATCELDLTLERKLGLVSVSRE
jgi:hypothetical protein